MLACRGWEGDGEDGRGAEREERGAEREERAAVDCVHGLSI